MIIQTFWITLYVTTNLIFLHTSTILTTSTLILQCQDHYKHHLLNRPTHETNAILYTLGHRLRAWDFRFLQIFLEIAYHDFIAYTQRYSY